MFATFIVFLCLVSIIVVIMLGLALYDLLENYNSGGMYITLIALLWGAMCAMLGVSASLM